MIKFTSINQFADLWFTSDTHYSHKNICRGVSNWDSGYRDFDSLDEMNDAIIKNKANKTNNFFMILIVL